jgi:hypothetical protein
VIAIERITVYQRKKNRYIQNIVCQKVQCLIPTGIFIIVNGAGSDGDRRSMVWDLWRNSDSGTAKTGIGTRTDTRGANNVYMNHGICGRAGNEPGRLVMKKWEF